ncbi:histone-like nucleoid-structuring protein, MvaT/MvaU family [Pseudomonas sp. CFBP 13719]|uniref:histone-like nucleoid-structuring protein, MvaT/MvaU family n=1 Tax=Pseudomonas sp. CFBP 13719 TaxID=2775303 RepID=UPI001781E726|nr:histone-like nucleoid-structuring protein, MvaT/MvaU family [Pseudomonas sp. CFBP 13719]MBD8682372.1 DNA binding protein [Pseudomonas sp. CFBP 13719]
MSRLAEYRQLEERIAQQAANLESRRSDPGLKREIEFETKLQGLLAQYGKSLKDIISIIEPGRGRAAVSSKPEKRTRRARQVKVYRNPLTGEIVESKGGNNKLLGAWKAQFGHDEVESWVKSS